MTAKWVVLFSNKAEKQYEKLKRNGSKRPSIVDVIDLLAQELELNGPCLSNWPHYGILEKENFHCHLKRGKPTYVACWRADRKAKQIEVYYVGTHEGAPY